MSSMIITKAGLDLLGSAYARGETNYWIGYYGLAFVPDKSADPITSDMTRLTESGDYIYNIWQGDLINGYATDSDPENAASNLFGLTLYSKGICSNYRYVLDADGNNNLVSWTSSGSSAGENTFNRTPFHIYRGNRYETDDTTSETSNVKSEIPVPAPLFYMNEPDKDNFAAPLSADAFGTSMCTSSGSSGYPPYPLNSTRTKYDRVPMVSTDARFYVGDGVAPTNVADFEAACSTDAYKWMNSSDTRPATAIDEDDKFYNRQYWKMRSISNFNRFHGTVSGEGYGVSSVSSCHNMSRATKLFPISYYTVVNDNGNTTAETEINDSGANEELASAIKFSIDLSLIAKDDNFSLADYDNENLPDEDAVLDANGTNLYSTKYNSFKFNRVGIYAVPMTIHRYAKESGSTACDAQHIQFEINGDAEPILFAVADIDIFKISDNDEGNGLNKFTLDFILNLSGASADSAVIRDTAIFYNMYENSAITWYENQLLASAGLSEAITALQIQMNYLKSQMQGSSTSSCCSQNLDLSMYALKNHTHDYLRNLVDGYANTGAVRGINTHSEGDDVNILSPNGLADNAPSSTMQSYANDTLKLYTYSLGFANYNNERPDGTEIDTSDTKYAATVTMTTAMIDKMIQNLGVADFISKVIGNENLGKIQSYDSKGTAQLDTDHAYIWITGNNVAVINKNSGEYTTFPVSSDDTGVYYNFVRTKDADVISSLSGTYYTGENTLVLGDGTMGAGNEQIVQGTDTYADKKSTYAVVVGNASMVTESPWTVLLNGDGSNVRKSDNVLAAGRMLSVTGAGQSIINGRSSTLNSVTRSILNVSAVHNGSMSIYDSIIDGGTANLNNVVSRTLLINCNSTSRTMNVNGAISDALMINNDGYDVNANLSKVITIGTQYGLFSEVETTYAGLYGKTLPTLNSWSSSSINGSNIVYGSGLRVSVTGDTNTIGGADIGDYSSVYSHAPVRSSTTVSDVSVNGYGNLVKFDTNRVIISGDNNIIPAWSTGVIALGNNNFTYRNGMNDETATIMSATDFVSATGLSQGNYVLYGGASGVTPNTVGISTYVIVDSDGNKFFNAQDKYLKYEYSANPVQYTNVVAIGDNNTLGSKSSNTVVIGNNYMLPYATVSDSILAGEAFSITNFAIPDQTATSDAVYHVMDNVKILSGGYSLNTLASDGDTSTVHYSDALIFTPKNFIKNDSKIYGIFANSDADTYLDLRVSQYISSAGTYNRSGHIFNGLTVDEMRDYINKPKSTMIYTGGIALLGGAQASSGEFTSTPYGLLKLGSDIKSVSYVESYPVSKWSRGYGGLINAHPVVGTTASPYKGCVLMVDETQEYDGTLHIKLGKISGSTIDMSVPVVSAVPTTDLYDGEICAVEGTSSLTLEVYHNGKWYTTTLS